MKVLPFLLALHLVYTSLASAEVERIPYEIFDGTHTAVIYRCYFAAIRNDRKWASEALAIMIQKYRSDQHDEFVIWAMDDINKQIDKGHTVDMVWRALACEEPTRRIELMVNQDMFPK